MLKKTLYPKTKRVPSKLKNIEITEKLDGSNLCLFKKKNYPQKRELSQTHLSCHVELM